jgi:hypothetical protein
MARPYSHLQYAPQAPQAPINHAVGVTSYTKDSSDPVVLAAQWAPLGRSLKRTADDSLIRDAAIDGPWTQTQICQRRKLITETVAVKSKPKSKAAVLSFSGVARDPTVSTPDRERSPQMAVSNRGLVPVALPYRDDDKTLVPGTLVYFANDSVDQCHGTLRGNKGIPINMNTNSFSRTKDTVGTVLSCGPSQHAVVHLHPLSQRSLKTFKDMLLNSTPDNNQTVHDRAGGATIKQTDGKHMVRINLGYACGVNQTDMLTTAPTGTGAPWTKRSAFTAVPTGGAPAPKPTSIPPPVPPVVAAAPAPKPKPKASRRKPVPKK